MQTAKTYTKFLHHGHSHRHTQPQEQHVEKQSLFPIAFPRGRILSPKCGKPFPKHVLTSMWLDNKHRCQHAANSFLLHSFVMNGISQTVIKCSFGFIFMTFARIHTAFTGIFCFSFFSFGIRLHGARGRGSRNDQSWL